MGCGQRKKEAWVRWDRSLNICMNQIPSSQNWRSIMAGPTCPLWPPSCPFQWTSRPNFRTNSSSWWISLIPSPIILWGLRFTLIILVQTPTRHSSVSATNISMHNCVPWAVFGRKDREIDKAGVLAHPLGAQARGGRLSQSLRSVFIWPCLHLHSEDSSSFVEVWAYYPRSQS